MAGMLGLTQFFGFGFLLKNLDLFVLPQKHKFKNGRQKNFFFELDPEVGVILETPPLDQGHDSSRLRRDEKNALDEPLAVRGIN